MLRTFLRPHVRPPKLSQCRLQSQLKICDPLRILFCGSDGFSIASLNALHREHERNPEFIESIDVVCRPGKRIGTGLKAIRDVPVSFRAAEFGLPLHQVDTFTGWEPPQNKYGDEINLIIAVSFGRLVPPRLLNRAKYGGLNVHPSLLPQFRGAAPVHHTLLAGHTRTGLTLQTLHPSKMDHGAILAQTPRPGLPVPDPHDTTVSAFTHRLGSLGASLLLEGLKQRLFVPPIRDLTPELDIDSLGEIKPAPKITPEDRHINWATWSSDKIRRRARIVGPLWSTVEEAGSEKAHRCIWSSELIELEDFVKRHCFLDARRRKPDAVLAPNTARLVCQPGVGYVSPQRDYVIVGTVDGKFLVTKNILLAGLQASIRPGDALLKFNVIPKDTWERLHEPDGPIRIAKPFV